MNDQRKAVKFLGQYRSGLKREDVGLYYGVVKTLLRCGRQGEGILANRLREHLGSEKWNSCINRLSEWQLVEFEPARHGRARVVALTAQGQGCGIEFNDEQGGNEQPQNAEHQADGSLGK